MRKNKYFTAITMAAAIASMTAVNYQAEEQAAAVYDTKVAPENAPDQNMDMSSLELPEGFKPFDEEHVPDGKNAPEKGELKPIEFDENGNMTYGQKPEGMPEGNRPGQMPQGSNASETGQTFGDGQAPENNQVPENGQAPGNGQMNGQMPPMGGGRPGQMPQGNNGSESAESGDNSQAPENNQAPGNGQMPENGQAPQNGQAPGNGQMNGRMSSMS